MEDRLNRDVSRRTMLKRIGAAGAVAWSAPALTSLGSKAWAQASDRCGASDWTCGAPQVLCGETPEGQVCLCDVDVAGKPVCWMNIACSESPACDTNADCPPGWICATSCCGQSCLPLCDSQAQTSGTGPSASGAVL